MAKAKDLEVRDKREVTTAAEQTKPGLLFTPAVDIFETDSKITLLADLPGVAVDGINIDLRDDVLTIFGDLKPWEGPDESDVFVEFEIGRYYRQFALSEVIDQEKMAAKLEDGVLRLVMPKAEKALPRKIAVTAA